MPKRLLILDDDDIQRDLLEAVLSLEGFEVQPVASGDAALGLLRTETPVAGVLSDLVLPGLAGESLLRTLRHAMPAAAILLGMSARPPARAIQELCDGFLLKPFSVPAFRDCFAAAERRRSHEVSATTVNTCTEGTDLIAVGAASVIHEATLASLRSMIPAGQLSNLYRMALEDIGRRHERMRSAASLGDLSTTQREAHAVKGSCGMLGAVELQQLAANIEGKRSLDPSLIAEIPAACHRLQQALEYKLERL